MRYRPHEFAEIAGVTVKTLQRWDNSGKLNAERTIGGHRYYTDDHLRQIKGIAKVTKKKVIYCRVSSSAQKPELKNQVEAMTSFCTANGVVIDKVIEEIGGGLNFKRKKFLGLLTEILKSYVCH